MNTFHLNCRYFTGHSNNPDGTTEFVAGTTGAKQGFMGAIRIFTIAVCNPTCLAFTLMETIREYFFLSQLILPHFPLGNYCGCCCA
jgi:hypothetical protein